MAYSIVYIGAHWCVSCKKIQPQIESLAKRFQIPISLRDYDNDLTDEERDRIQKVPTVRICKDEAIVETYWSNQVDSVESWLRKNISMTTDAEF